MTTFESTVTCPHCGHRSAELMVVDVCLLFYRCKGCGVLMRPPQGGCCVFCTYGSERCPPVQKGRGCCG